MSQVTHFETMAWEHLAKTERNVMLLAIITEWSLGRDPVVEESCHLWTRTMNYELWAAILVTRVQGHVPGSRYLYMTKPSPQVNVCGLCCGMLQAVKSLARVDRHD